MFRLLFLIRLQAFFIVIFPLCFQLRAVAQSSDEKDDGVALSVYYDRCLTSGIQPKGWKNFVDSYNKVVAPTTSLTNFKNVSMYDIGVRADLDKLIFQFSFQHMERECSATFAFNEQRIFNLKNNAFTLGLGRNIVRAFKNRLKVSLYGDIRFGSQLILTAGYKYRDGFVSYGGDLDLNGSYNGLVVLGSEFGTLLRYKIYKGFTFEAKLAYQFNNNIAPSSFSDISSYKALNSSNSLGALSFPADYTKYDPNNAGSYEELKSAHNGYKFCIGLAYEF